MFTLAKSIAITGTALLALPLMASSAQEIPIDDDLETIELGAPPAISFEDRLAAVRTTGTSVSGIPSSVKSEKSLQSNQTRSTAVSNCLDTLPGANSKTVRFFNSTGMGLNQDDTTPVMPKMSTLTWLKHRSKTMITLAGRRNPCVNPNLLT